MNAQHTAGPWKVKKSNTGSDFLHVESGTVERIAVVRFAADANLISAAPDLLDALNKLMALESRGRVMPVGREWDAARAAIAKVEGAKS